MNSCPQDVRLCWTQLGVRMGYTSTQVQRAQILAARKRMRWTQSPSDLPCPDAPAARAVINAVFAHRPDQLRLQAVAELGAGRRLIGLQDAYGARSYVLDLGAEAIVVLTEVRKAKVAQRRAQRAEAGPQQDCRHPCAHHLHGTRAAYVKDRCRCTPCRAANTAASNAHHRERTFGRPSPFTGAGPTRAHIQRLRGDGIGIDQIAKLTSISTGYLRELVYGRAGRPRIQRVRPETAQRLLRVQISDANRAAASHVNATGTRRRLQALVAIGWTQTALAAELGRSATNLQRSMTSKAVTAHTARRVTKLYQRLWNIQPPHASSAQRAAIDAARARAARHGWQPPLAWDDIDIDIHSDIDPELHPSNQVEDAKDDYVDEIALERALAGDGVRLEHLTPAEQQEVIRRLTERGKSIRDIADQLATTKRTVSRRRRSIHAA